MIKTKLGAPLSSSDLYKIDPEITTPQQKLYRDNFETHNYVPDAKDDINPKTGDHYIDAKVSLPCGGTQQAGKVVWHARDHDGELTGAKHHNPILNTCSYQVNFLDGEIGEYSTKIIVQNMLSQCDPDGNQFLLKEAIVDHKGTDEALLKPREMHVIINGQ